LPMDVEIIKAIPAMHTTDWWFLGLALWEERHVHC
jgi:hypothetical protein